MQVFFISRVGRVVAYNEIPGDIFSFINQWLILGLGPGGLDSYRILL